MDSIQMKIAKTAAKNWGQKEPETIEESLGITWDSEVAAVKGIAKTLNLDDSVVNKLVGTKDDEGKLKRDGEIYTRDTISPEVASQIKEAMKGKDKNKTILKILSTIHDSWVRNNSDNFLKPDRNKERQFVSLQLLDWEEVESDLLFLKPILEGAGIQIDEEQLKKQHELEQTEYMIDKGIFSHEDLIKHLSKGSKSYKALDGLDTKNGGNIHELLQNPEIAEKMAGQIESKVPIKSREELAVDLIKSDNPILDQIYWIETVRYDTSFNEEKCPKLNQPITLREIMLSKLIGKPYPTYILEGISDHNYNRYENELRAYFIGDENYAADQYEGHISRIKERASEENSGRKGIVSFGYDKSSNRIPGNVEITLNDLYKAGLDPKSMGWKEKTKARVNPKEMAKMGVREGLTLIDYNKVKDFFNRILDRDRNDGGKGEK